jgi:deferrochelatase/peroxidase EfeB
VTVTPAQPQFDLADIQGNLLRGYRSANARHFALGIGNPGMAAAFVGGLISGDEDLSPQITTAEEWDDRPPYRLNIGLTWAGLQALGVPVGVLGDFPQAFQQGPALRAGQQDPDFPNGVGLGDRDGSAPANWVLGGLTNPTVHVLVSLYTDEHRHTHLDEVSMRLRQRFAATDLTEIWCGDANALPHGGVHFGYRDGIAQPEIEGANPRDRPDMQPKAGPGDFLLGRDYVNVFGGNYLGNLLPQLGDNATYAAFRVLRQDVRAFEQLLKNWGDQWGKDPELLAAKLLGRWRNGVPLTLSPEIQQTDPPIRDARLNDFDYAPATSHTTYYDDFEGRRCPIGAHIRRLNPRSALVAGLPYSRRLIRRGMPYGPPFDPEHPDDGNERGLMGLFICGDLDLQYEFILRTWANEDLATNGLRGTRDPLIGQQPPNGGQFVLRVDDSRDPIVLTGIPTLVQTRGSVYCFVPGIGGLRYLASVSGGATS